MIGLVLLACAPRMPSAAVEEVTISRLGLTEAGAVVLLGIDNPLLVEIPVRRLSWDLAVAGRPLAAGVLDEPTPLAANDVTKVRVPVDFAYSDLWAAMGQVGGEVPYRLAAELTLDGPRGPIALPVAHEGTLPALQPPTVDLVAIRPAIDGAKLSLEVELKLGLPPAMALQELAWTAAVDGTVLSSGSAAIGDAGQVTLPIVFDAAASSEVTWNAVWGANEVLTLSLTGSVSSPLGPIPIALQHDVPLLSE